MDKKAEAVAKRKVDGRYVVLDLLKMQSERDKQSKVGPSGIGNPCDYCLALDILGQRSKYNHFWMGARIGTAIHETLESTVNGLTGTLPNRLTVLEDAITECRVTVKEIEGYGTVKGSADLVLPEAGVVIDYKTSTRTKMQGIQVNGLPKQYIVQQQLYMYGLNKNHGLSITEAQLVFIARDGTSDADVSVYTIQYDEEIAEDALDRFAHILRSIHDSPESVEELASWPDCWACKNKYLRT